MQLVLSHYPLREDSLPARWTFAVISQIARLVVPGFPQGRHNQEKHGVPHIRPMNVDREGRLDLRVLKYVDGAVPRELRKGDILFNNTNSPELIGKTTIVSTDARLAYSNHMTRICLEDGLDPAFVARQLHYLWMSGYFRHRCVNHVNQASLSTGPLSKTVPILIAPPAEQSQIADTLDELFSDLDAGVAALKRARDRLQLYRASVLKTAVEGALTADWRKQHPNAEPASELLKRILVERRRHWEEDQLRKFEEKGKAPPKNWKAKYKEPVAPDTADLPPLPEGWCWATVAQIGETITGVTPSTNNPDFFGGNVPFFKPTDLDQGYYLKDYRESLSNEGVRIGRLLPALSILVTCIGATIGKLGLARVDCTCNQQINALTINDTLLSPHYIYWFLASPFGQRAVIRNASATTLPILNKSRFQALPIAISPIAEQKAIVEIVENQLSVTDRLEADIDAKLQSAQALRQSILKHAFTGKLVPQDPHDEPAAELLKRIAAERTARPR